MDISMFKRYQPDLMMDQNEPFYPREIGCTMFTETRQSDSFNRIIKVEDPVEKVLEYAIYWDYDIQHLYDLEHIWVYVGRDGQVLECEVSFHGKYIRGLLRNRENLLEENRVVLYCQPGKHAFAPLPLIFELLPNYEQCTMEQAGKDGLGVTAINKGRFVTDDKEEQLIKDHLKTWGFKASGIFKKWSVDKTLYVPWQILYDHIPIYLEEVLEGLRNKDE